MSDAYEQYQRAAAILREHPNRETGAGADPSDLQQVASLMTHELPAEYRSFLREFGWGGAQDLEILGAGSDVPQFLSIMVETQRARLELVPILPPSLLPLSRDGFGNTYCLFQPEAADEEWPVVLWDHDDGTASSVAPSFASWLLSQLHELE